MSLFTKVIQAVQSWRRRRGAVKSRTGARVGLEQLDHRQLMAVNFTGVVATDFPATQVPGVVTILDNGQMGVQRPILPSGNANANLLSSIVKVSGFDVNGIATSYDPTSDTLSVGLIQPLNQKPDANGNQYPVIAGDADNNGDSATVDPTVLALRPRFEDPANLSGTEFMAISLNFTGSQPNPNIPGTMYFPADVVAGFGQLPDPKHYEVALPVPGTNFRGVPAFGTELPGNEGTYSLINDPTKGAFEFSITHFSQLYTQRTGKPLTPNSVIAIGEFSGSQQDDGISEETFPPQPFSLAQASPPLPPPPPVVCPPVSPPVLINPHSARHVNTAHGENVRVTILGSSGFDPTQIDPATVRLGGAAPYTEFARNVNHDDFLDETLVFRGYDISLPAGITPATVTGQLFNGTKFATTQLIFNKNDSYYTPVQIAARDAKLGFTPPEELALEMASANANGDPATIKANILATNAQAAATAETIPSNDATFAPASMLSTMPATPIVISQSASLPPIAPALATIPLPPPAPTVSIPRKTVHSFHKGGRAVPAMQSGTAFHRARPARTASSHPASKQTSALNAQDAVLASFAS